MRLAQLEKWEHAKQYRFRDLQGEVSSNGAEHIV